MTPFNKKSNHWTVVNPVYKTEAFFVACGSNPFRLVHTYANYVASCRVAVNKNITNLFKSKPAYFAHADEPQARDYFNTQ